MIFCGWCWGLKPAPGAQLLRTLPPSYTSHPDIFVTIFFYISFSFCTLGFVRLGQNLEMQYQIKGKDYFQTW
jgi:hypothetical protein